MTKIEHAGLFLNDCAAPGFYGYSIIRYGRRVVGAYVGSEGGTTFINGNWYGGRSCGFRVKVAEPTTAQGIADSLLAIRPTDGRDYAIAVFEWNDLFIYWAPLDTYNDRAFVLNGSNGGESGEWVDRTDTDIIFTDINKALAYYCGVLNRRMDAANRLYTEFMRTKAIHDREAAEADAARRNDTNFNFDPSCVRLGTPAPVGDEEWFALLPQDLRLRIIGQVRRDIDLRDRLIGRLRRELCG